MLEKQTLVLTMATLDGLIGAALKVENTQAAWTMWHPFEPELISSNTSNSQGGEGTSQKVSALNSSPSGRMERKIHES